jgi:acetyltransferase-like isoleucine patch superfamily enzyme
MTMRLWEKLLFTVRYCYAKLTQRGLHTTGFVFLEPDVTFKIAPGGSVLLEQGVYIKKGAIIECAGSGTLVVKSGANVGHYAWIGSTHRVEIGVRAIIGQGASVFDVYHIFSRGKFIAEQGYTQGATAIGDDCLIAAKATVGANVTMGRGAVAAANSVVISDVPEYTIVGGVPAKIIKERT